MEKVKITLFLLIFVFSLANCCPRGENIRPCICQWPGHEDQFYLTCPRLDNFQDLEKATTFFRGKEKLYAITIQDSTFMYIPSEAFRGLKIPLLVINNSTLMSLTDTDTAFVGLEDYLEYFHMTGTTVMNEWDWSILRNLRKLKQLHIKEGYLEYIGNFEHVGIDNLEDIDFEDNRISFVHSNAFSNCKKLVKLSLKNNEISKVTRSILPNPAPTLLGLDFRNNNIESFPDDMFTNMPKLWHLSIGYNKILVLNENVFTPVWSQLVSFEALGNDLRCDCRITWILPQKFPGNVRAICSHPKEQKGKSLTSLAAKDLWCYQANETQ